MKVGDLIECCGDLAIILEVYRYLDKPTPGHPLDDVLWLKCLWCDGNMSSIASDEVRLISESR